MLHSYTFHVKGMHCNSCVILTESTLKEVQGVLNAKTSLQNNSVEVTGDFGTKTREQVQKELNNTLKPHGYTLTSKIENKAVNWNELLIALPIALVFVVVFLLFQKIGIVNLVDTSNIGYGTVFVIGMIASVSTCMAVVGGLALSMSANFAKGGDKVRPQAMFHLGRLVSFFVLGGVIGALGSVFQISATGMLILGLFVALVLLVLGLNLLDVFPWAKRLQLTVPNGIGKRAYGLKDANHLLTPLVVGIVTFFLPCGFTQSMQLYALTTGSFLKGGLTMFVFALGTLPVLALLSFSALGIQKHSQSSIFFKTVGLIVIFFAIMNILTTLAAAGIISPIFTL